MRTRRMSKSLLIRIVIWSIAFPVMLGIGLYLRSGDPPVAPAPTTAPATAETESGDGALAASISIQPPTTADADGQPAAPVLTLSQDGAMALDGVAIADQEALRTELAKAKAANPAADSLVLRADRRVDYQSVVQAMTTVRESQFRLVLVTEPEAP